MKIINKTRWDTRDLRRVFAAVLRRWNKTDNRKVPSRRLKNVNVVSARWRGVSGCAYVASGWMTIRLPKEKEQLDVEQIGFVFEHELAHCAGYQHSEMGPLNSWKMVTIGRYDYLRGFEIRAKVAPAPKVRSDRQVERYQREVASLARWRTKLKRAQTGVKAHQAKVKRYERILAADGRLAALTSKR